MIRDFCDEYLIGAAKVAGLASAVLFVALLAGVGLSFEVVALPLLVPFAMALVNET